MGKKVSIYTAWCFVGALAIAATIGAANNLSVGELMARSLISAATLSGVFLLIRYIMRRPLLGFRQPHSSDASERGSKVDISVGDDIDIVTERVGSPHSRLQASSQRPVSQAEPQRPVSQAEPQQPVSQPDMIGAVHGSSDEGVKSADLPQEGAMRATASAVRNQRPVPPTPTSILADDVQPSVPDSSLAPDATSSPGSASIPVHTSAPSRTAAADSTMPSIDPDEASTIIRQMMQ